MNDNVALVHCNTYDEVTVAGAVRRAVDAVGGMRAFVDPGQRVLLKVNLLRAAAPDAAVSTHPTVVKAVTRLVQEAGASVVIGDSPGGPFQRTWLRAVYRQSGMAQVAEETGAELNWNLDYQMVPHPDGHLTKALEIGDYVTDADVVIALPKLKTHSFMQFTGATKILFGAIPGTVKMAYHAKFPQPERFGDMLIDILTLIRPALTIMDGVVGMDGQGPSAGDPFPVGALLASKDAIALDVVAATLVGMDIQTIYPLQAAIRRGLTSGRVEDIQVLGDGLRAFGIRGFRAPDNQPTQGRLLASLRLTSRIGELFKQQMTAVPSADGLCIGCGICARNCPVGAIEIREGHAQMDLHTCIRCYCCHELCPEHAVELRKPWLRRVADRALGGSPSRTVER